MNNIEKRTKLYTSTFLFSSRVLTVYRRVPRERGNRTSRTCRPVTIESSSHTGAPPGRYFGRDEPLWRGGKTGLGTGSVARRYSGRPTRTIVCIRTGRFVDVSICGFASFVSASGGRSSVLFDAIGKSRMVKKPIFFTPL